MDLKVGSMAALVVLASLGMAAPALSQTNNSDTSGTSLFSAPSGSILGDSGNVTISAAARQQLVDSATALVGTTTASVSLKSLKLSQAEPEAVSESTKTALLAVIRRFETFDPKTWNLRAAAQEIQASTSGLSQDVAAAQQACEQGSCDRLNFLAPRVTAFLDSLDLVQNELIQQYQRNRLF